MLLQKYKKIVFIFFLCLVFPYQSIHAASLYIQPSQVNVAAGNIVSVSILVDTSGQAINSADMTIQFPTDTLEVMSISRTGSIFPIWVEEPTFSNAQGTISVSGGLPAPGYTGSAGKIVSIVFTAKKTGTASILISSGSIRANDGLGTDILTNKGSAQVNLVAGTKEVVQPKTTQAAPTSVTSTSAPVIQSSSHPDQTKWYGLRNVSVSWDIPQGATAMKVSLDSQAKTIPDEDSPVVSSKQFTDVSDGVRYVHVRFRTASGWGQTGHLKVQIDATPPDPFSIKFPHEATSSDPRPVMLFNTSDKTSGVAYYNIKIGDKDYMYIDPTLVTSNPYTPPPQNPGPHEVIVEAVDRAGNISTNKAGFEIEAITAPTITYYTDEFVEGDILKVRGITYPLAQVELILRDKNNNTYQDFAKANLSGDFSIVWAKHVPAGTYKMTAIATDSRNAKSLETAPLTVVVSSKPLFVLGKIIVTYTSIIVFIIFCSLLVFFGAWYMWTKFRLYRARIKNEIDEVDQTIHKAFALLSQDLETEIKALEKVKRKRSLTTEEERIIKRFRKSFADAEKVLEKELNDIEKEMF